ncbi:hypothetical protein C5613_41485 [Rhodococcus opacus]|uniref:PIN like domain-containing protein n=1 Tax=Rhodococcus opacus TaxID=37919 RepID=A0A2S8IGW6_RHOOP|nr:hypothetical protein C5613_41485 [Rhodococcus opacus]
MTQLDPDVAPFFGNAVIALDANVLLELYSMSSATRSEIIDVFFAVQDRLWIPHQVALEYSRNRRNSVIKRNERFSAIRKVLTTSQAQALGKLGAAIDSFVKFRSQSHTVRDWDPGTYGVDKVGLKSRLDGIWKDTLVEVNLLQSEIDISVEDLNSDEILKRLDDLITGRVGQPYFSQELRVHVEHATRFRFPNKIPPGYADADEKPTELLQAGDYLIWRQLLDCMQDMEETGAEKLVIFVTKDFKSDWWVLNDKDEVLSPRPELIDEMRDEAGAKLLMLSISDFLEGAKKHLKQEITDAAIHEVEEQEQELASYASSVIRQYVAARSEVMGSDRRAQGSLVTPELAETMRRAQGSLVTPELAETMRRAQSGLVTPELAETMRRAQGSLVTPELAETMRRAQSGLVTPELAETIRRMQVTLANPAALRALHDAERHAENTPLEWFDESDLDSDTSGSDGTGTRGAEMSSTDASDY